MDSKGFSGGGRSDAHFRRRRALPLARLFIWLGFAGITNFASGATFGNFVYTDDGTAITITGVVTPPVGMVDIPETINEKPVTRIAGYAFYRCTELTGVMIPGGVTSIGDYAFAYCIGLTSAAISDGVTTIGYAAFFCCSELTTLSIPSSVTSIEAAAFYYCSGLKSVTISSSVTTIDRQVFSGCTGLTSVAILVGVTSIGVEAFANCTGLTSVAIPASVTWIGNNAFAGCSGLTSVVIPASVIQIFDGAFVGCSRLTSLAIPASVTSIGDYAFFNCSGLISVDTSNPNYSSVDGVLFDKLQTTLIQCPSSKVGAFTIPSSVSSIGKSAFSECQRLTSVMIPGSVTSIGDSAFGNCTGLKSATIPASVTTIGDYVFKGCSGMASVTIPSGVTSIGKSAFANCTGLTSVTIPSSVTKILSSAFSNCSKLTSAEFLGNAPSMGSGSRPFGTDVFDFSASGFTVKFHSGKSGFTTPTWKGYAAVNIDLILPYATWEGSKFLPADIATGWTTMMTDFDGDGMANLLEYAFGMDPKSANVSSVALNATGSNLQISFPCDAGCTDVTYTVQSSSTLATDSWSDIAQSAGGAATAPVGSLSAVSDSGTGLRTVTVTDSTPLPVGGKRFLRVKVTAAP